MHGGSDHKLSQHSGSPRAYGGSRSPRRPSVGITLNLPPGHGGPVAAPRRSPLPGVLKRASSSFQDEDDFHQSIPARARRDLHINNANNSIQSIQKAVDQVVWEKQINLEKHPIKEEEILAIVDLFGVKMTQVQLAEAKLGGCGGSHDIRKFSFSNFVKWFSQNMPLMHYKGAGFNLPGQTARRNSEFYTPASTNNRNFQFMTGGQGGAPSIGSGVSSPLGTRYGAASKLGVFSPKSINQETPDVSGQDFANSRNVHQPWGGNSRRSFSVARTQKALDYSCGDPFLNLKKELKNVYGDPRKLDEEIMKTVDSLSKFPRLKRDI